MGREEWNAIRHPKGEEVEALPASDWDRGDVILASWMDTATYEANLRLLEERGMAPRYPDDADDPAIQAKRRQWRGTIFER